MILPMSRRLLDALRPASRRRPGVLGSVSRRHLGVLAAAALVTSCAGAPALARSGPDSFAPLVKRVLPSVVNIAVTETVTGNDPLSQLPPELQRQFRNRFRSRPQQTVGAGSGFIIDSSGIIVTNNHVVGSADRIVVSLSDGTQYPARLLGVDEATDIAVIKVDAPNALPAAEWGDSRLVEVGDWVLAAGNPFGLGGSVSAGIISARGRDLGAGPFDDFLQIDAPINPGNSGGPLFNTDGLVVGINTAIYSPNGGSVGIGFSIPSELVSRVVAELRSKGRIDRGWLGVSLQDVPAAGRNAGGVGVMSLVRAGPAARSGLRTGDIITAVNGQPIDNARTLVRAVAAIPPGNIVQLTLRRQSSTLDVSVTLGRKPKTEEN
jgi:serine protease Do